MFKKYIKLFIKNSEDVDNPVVRKKYGNLAGITGIIINIILSAAKIVAGLLIGAISVVSDGINNLSDAGSSVITLIGFKLSAKKPDKEHPFGHGRMEYFAGLAVSVIIIVVAIKLFIESVGKITDFKKSTIESQNVVIITCTILGVSILCKFWMAFFNKYIGKKIKSVALEATCRDSLSDCISTTVVLICTILSLFVDSFPIDGIAGIIVSLFILYTGYNSVSEVMAILLGSAPDPKLVKEIANYTLAFDERVVGIHDLMFHDYGPGRQFLTLHVEVPAEGNVMELHDLIDNIEGGLNERFNLLTTIHMDPVVTKSERVTEIKEFLRKVVKELDSEFNIHDFRMNEGETHANLIFDLVITNETKLTKDEILDYVKKKVKEYDSKLNIVALVEYSYV